MEKEKKSRTWIFSGSEQPEHNHRIIEHLMKSEEPWLIDVGDKDNNEVHVIYRHFDEGRKMETTLVVTDVQREVLEFADGSH